MGKLVPGNITNYLLLEYTKEYQKSVVAISNVCYNIYCATRAAGLIKGRYQRSTPQRNFLLTVL